MTPFDKFAQENGFQLKLGRWNFVYSEKQKNLTIPVEFLMKGEALWKISKENIKAWDAPFDSEKIDPIKAENILTRIEHFVELTGKNIQLSSDTKMIPKVSISHSM